MVKWGRRSVFVVCFLAFAPTLAPQEAPQVPIGAEVAKLIRSTGLDETECYRVRDIALVKEDLRLYLNDGLLIFAKPIHGQRWAAVFSGDVEGGDGEVLLLPPYRGERQSLAKFTPTPNLDEHFDGAVLLFSDDSGDKLLNQIVAQNRGKKMAELAPLIAEQWNPILSNIAEGFELRLVGDLLTPGTSRPGLMFAAVAGKTLGPFDVFFDGRSTEQVLAGRMAEHKNRFAYDVWTSFPARSRRRADQSAPQLDFTSERYQIEAALDENLKLNAACSLSIKVHDNPVRVLPFEVSRGIEIATARIDGAPAELLFRESARARALRTDENEAFLLVAPQTLSPGSTHRIEFKEAGSVISRAGKDVFFVEARSNWYPRSGTGMAIYDLSFRYPRRLSLVSAGDLLEDRIEGDWHFTRKVTSVPIRVVGFNLGDYEKVGLVQQGFHVEVYGNRALEAALQPKLSETTVDTITVPLNSMPGRGGRRPAPLPPPPPPAPPDPLARLHSVATDVSSALQMFSGWFGPPIISSLTVSPIPGAFGQGFPGLIYLSTLAYLDPSARPASLRGPREQVFFSDLMQAHEVAHQWWGNLVMPAGYQDDWISEALANYCALLYLEKKKGTRAMQDVLEDFRDVLVKKASDGETVESAGPITLGFRLESAQSADAWHAITYDKGAWVFHMLRRRLGDERFLKMLLEFRHRSESQLASTLTLRELTKQFRPPGVRPEAIDGFFDNWVYSTGIPALKLTYSAKGAAPSVRLTGKVEQSGVDDDFSVEVPVEVQFAKGSAQTIWVETTNSGATFSASLKQIPSRVTLPIGTGVLAIKK
jgi:hypothetical protein